MGNNPRALTKTGLGTGAFQVDLKKGTIKICNHCIKNFVQQIVKSPEIQEAIRRQVADQSGRLKRVS